MIDNLTRDLSASERTSSKIRIDLKISMERSNEVSRERD